MQNPFGILACEVHSSSFRYLAKRVQLARCSIAKNFNQQAAHGGPPYDILAIAILTGEQDQLLSSSNLFLGYEQAYRPFNAIKVFKASAEGLSLQCHSLEFSIEVNLHT